jgi:integrin-linked kinase-associated serine/threonine phosphatase 2C
MERIRSLGGRDYKRRLGHPKYNPQVISLAVSRAIGDLFFKDAQFTDGHPSGLVAEPHISSKALCGARNWFLVLGCDGLWDVCDYSQVHDFVRKTLKSNTPQQVSQQLIEMAQEKGSPDNITVLVVYIENVADAD